MTRNDPNTGKFTPGNPGRPKGSKNVRTRRWEEVDPALRHMVSAAKVMRGRV